MSHAGQWNPLRDCQRPAFHSTVIGQCRSSECPLPDDQPTETESEPTEASTTPPTEFKFTDLAKVVVFLVGFVLFGYVVIGYLSSGPTHDAEWCDYQNDLMEIPGNTIDDDDADAFLKYCVNGPPEE